MSRANLVFYINGKRHEVGGQAAFQPLTDYLRYGQSLCGTKVVCAEGDCGACTVLVGRARTAGAPGFSYVPVNGCIQYLYQLDGCHILTVEGVTGCQSDDAAACRLNPAQEAMVVENGSQCGFCTPGFIMSLSAIAYCDYYKDYLGKGSLANQTDSLKSALTGNLCRCTGYEAIVKAAVSARYDQFQALCQVYDEQAILKDLEPLLSADVSVQWQDPGQSGPGQSGLGQSGSDQAATTPMSQRQVFIPSSVASLCSYLAENPDAVLVSGGTDVSVNMNKREFKPFKLVSTARLGLDQLKILDKDELEKSGLGKSGLGKSGLGTLKVGASVSLAQLEDYMKEACPEFYKILWVFGSPQIRHAGTLAGNIANGSPIADSVPFLMLAQAYVEATSAQGTRLVPMSEFYLGYKKLALRPGEFISAVYIPMPVAQEKIKLYKVSRREHLDISSFTAAFALQIESGLIKQIRVVMGGMAATIIRLGEVESFLTGKPFKLETFKQAGKMAASSLAPLTDVRGSREYRLKLAENIFAKLYHEIEEESLVKK
ncbi:MAG: FAD binding domain-containing protein [Candidatus Obscuribacter phosphatis]|uniref:FAD binding domain-containing protein n=1 Tax=Candidatus Obscuribacter phosphatis TaxID=1906157 RepID=A0A8J7PI52_9BACT|nr:FAD binding domain-containing protein [Candidatus Obscuribacter phosphatis]